MPKSIACPGCRRILTLPDEVMNQVVQCPACQHSFHPASADTASVRPTPALAGQASAPLPPRPVRRPEAPAEAPARKSRRRREEFDICPECRARVPQAATKCPECNVEFESEETDRPWERAGEERRDSDPHRGGLLLSMGIASMIVPIVSMCPIAGLVANIVGLSVGIGAWTMAVKDIRKMNKHQMDKSGRGTSQAGMICGIIGVCFNSLGFIASIWSTITYLLSP